MSNVNMNMSANAKNLMNVRVAMPLLLAAALAFAAVAALPAQAHAASVKSFLKGTYVTALTPKSEGAGSSGIDDYETGYIEFKTKSKLKKIKSSKRSVATLSRDYSYGGYHYYTIHVKKKGTTRLSFVYKGKKRSCKIKVTKYRAPLKKLVIGGRNYTSKANRYSDVYVSSCLYGGLNITAKSGWSISSVYVDGKKLSNGGNMPSHYYNSVEINMYNKRTKQHVPIRIGTAV